MKTTTKKKVVKTAAKVIGKVAANKVKASSALRNPLNKKISVATNRELVETIKAKKGVWQIHKLTHNIGIKAPGSKKEAEVEIVFGNTLIAKNGNVICSNFGFNTLQSAKKNIAAVKASA